MKIFVFMVFGILASFPLYSQSHGHINKRISLLEEIRRDNYYARSKLSSSSAEVKPGSDIIKRIKNLGIPAKPDEISPLLKELEEEIQKDAKIKTKLETELAKNDDLIKNKLDKETEDKLKKKEVENLACFQFLYDSTHNPTTKVSRTDYLL